jgi:hypothetical protein
LEASINAARIYILEKQMQHQQQDHGYYGPDGEYHDNEYHGDGEYHDGEYHQPATAGGCEEMCYMDMENMRFTDERAAKEYMNECLKNCEYDTTHGTPGGYYGEEGKTGGKEGEWEGDSSEWGNKEENKEWGGDASTTGGKD